MSAPPLVVEVLRSGAIESEHLVDVAVVDAGDVLIASAGDPDRPAAFRSSAKPLQAAVALEAGWRPRSDPHLAIACASHNGEREHVATVRAVLAEAGLDESALACPPAVPLAADAALGVTRAEPLLHNCSGKHAGLLAACVAAGWPTEGYRDSEHPLQRRIAERMRAMLGVDPRILADGCGIPTFHAPLAAFARAFSSAAGTRPAAAMRAHPFLVAGTGRFDTALMAASSRLVCKGGAEGLTCVTDGTTTVALKARDGAARGVGPAALLALGIMGMIDPEVEELAAHRSPAVLGGGERVGELRARGTLTRG